MYQKLEEVISLSLRNNLFNHQGLGDLATSPFVKNNTIREVIKKFKNNTQYDSVVPVEIIKHHMCIIFIYIGNLIIKCRIRKKYGKKVIKNEKSVKLYTKKLYLIVS